MNDAFVIYLPCTPPTLNHMFYTMNRRRVISKEHREFRAIVRDALAGEKLPNDWKYVTVDLILTPKQRYRMDGDNYFKATFDALTNCGFWEDDSKVSSARFWFSAPNREAQQTTLVVRRDDVKFKPLETLSFSFNLDNPIFIGKNLQ